MQKAPITEPQTLGTQVDADVDTSSNSEPENVAQNDLCLPERPIFSTKERHPTTNAKNFNLAGKFLQNYDSSAKAVPRVPAVQNDENYPNKNNFGNHRRMLTQPTYSHGPVYNNFFTPRDLFPQQQVDNPSQVLVPNSRQKVSNNANTTTNLSTTKNISGYEMNRSLKNSMRNKPRKIGSPDLPQQEKFESPEPCPRSTNPNYQHLQAAPSTPKSKSRRIRSPASPSVHLNSNKPAIHDAGVMVSSTSKPRQPGPVIQQDPPLAEKHFQDLTPIKRESSSNLHKNQFASPNVVPCRSSTLLKNELKNQIKQGYQSPNLNAKTSIENLDQGGLFLYTHHQDGFTLKNKTNLLEFKTSKAEPSTPQKKKRGILKSKRVAKCLFGSEGISGENGQKYVSSSGQLSANLLEFDTSSMRLVTRPLPRRHKFETDFQVVKKMGQGEFGIVYKAIALKENGKKRAVKKQKEKYIGLKDRDIKIQEVAKSFQICSPNHQFRPLRNPYSKFCIGIVEAWEEQGYLYMSTELCEKGNLNEFIIRELLYKKPQNEQNNEGEGTNGNKSITQSTSQHNQELKKETKASTFVDDKDLKLDFKNLDSLLLGDGPNDEIMTPEPTLVREDETMQTTANKFTFPKRQDSLIFTDLKANGPELRLSRCSSIQNTNQEIGLKAVAEDIKNETKLLQSQEREDTNSLQVINQSSCQSVEPTKREIDTLQEEKDSPDSLLLQEEQVWQIFADMVRGVAHVHERNFIHLDIKPSNFFVTQQNRIKLGDFGKAIHVNQVDGLQDHEAEGDSVYIAPEVFSREITQKADIFSLGASLLEIAASMNLPQNGLLWQRLRDGSKITFSPSAKRSLAIEEIINKMMSPNPSDRPSTEELLLHPKLQQLSKTASGTFSSGTKKKDLLNLDLFESNSPQKKHQGAIPTHMQGPTNSTNNQISPRPHSPWIQSDHNNNFTPENEKAKRDEFTPLKVDKAKPSGSKPKTTIVISPSTVANEQRKQRQQNQLNSSQPFARSLFSKNAKKNDKLKQNDEQLSRPSVAPFALASSPVRKNLNGLFSECEPQNPEDDQMRQIKKTNSYVRAFESQQDDKDAEKVQKSYHTKFTLPRVLVKLESSLDDSTRAPNNHDTANLFSPAILTPKGFANVSESPMFSTNLLETDSDSSPLRMQLQPQTEIKDTFNQLQQSVVKDKKRSINGLGGQIRGKLFDDYSKESPKVTNKPRGSWMVDTPSNEGFGGDSSSQQSVGSNALMTSVEKPHRLVRKQELSAANGKVKIQQSQTTILNRVQKNKNQSKLLSASIKQSPLGILQEEVENENEYQEDVSCGEKSNEKPDQSLNFQQQATQKPLTILEFNPSPMHQSEKVLFSLGLLKNSALAKDSTQKPVNGRQESPCSSSKIFDYEKQQTQNSRDIGSAPICLSDLRRDSSNNVSKIVAPQIQQNVQSTGKKQPWSFKETNSDLQTHQKSADANYLKHLYKVHSDQDQTQDKDENLDLQSQISFQQVKGRPDQLNSHFIVQKSRSTNKFLGEQGGNSQSGDQTNVSLHSFMPRGCENRSPNLNNHTNNNSSCEDQSMSLEQSCDDQSSAGLFMYGNIKQKLKFSNASSSQDGNNCGGSGVIGAGFGVIGGQNSHLMQINTANRMYSFMSLNDNNSSPNTPLNLQMPDSDRDQQSPVGGNSHIISLQNPQQNPQIQTYYQEPSQIGLNWQNHRDFEPKSCPNLQQAAISHQQSDQKNIFTESALRNSEKNQINRNAYDEKTPFKKANCVDMPGFESAKSSQQRVKVNVNFGLLNFSESNMEGLRLLPSDQFNMQQITTHPQQEEQMTRPVQQAAQITESNIFEQPVAPVAPLRKQQPKSNLNLPTNLIIESNESDVLMCDESLAINSEQSQDLLVQTAKGQTKKSKTTTDQEMTILE